MPARKFFETLWSQTQVTIDKLYSYFERHRNDGSAALLYAYEEHMVIGDVTNKNIDAVRAFLHEHSDTTLFLRSNLEAHGPRLGGSLNSGNFKYIESDNGICGVFCLTRRGNLLAETGGRTDLAAAILDACLSEPMPIRGVLGEWSTADALWQRLVSSPNFVERHRSREVLQRLELPKTIAVANRFEEVRRLGPEDFVHWDPLNRAFMEEEGLPIQGTPEQRRSNFYERASAGFWWGYRGDGRLLATVALNAVHLETGQVGGVYTTPSSRRRGLARALMHALIEDSVRLHRLTRLILFTGEKNHAAQALYESLGFVRVGEFALFFGDSISGGAERDA